jgi:hypothetical protein
MGAGVLDGAFRPKVKRGPSGRTDGPGEFRTARVRARNHCDRTGPLEFQRSSQTWQRADVSRVKGSCSWLCSSRLKHALYGD